MPMIKIVNNWQEFLHMCSKYSPFYSKFSILIAECSVHVTHFQQNIENRR